MKEVGGGVHREETQSPWGGKGIHHRLEIVQACTDYWSVCVCVYHIKRGLYGTHPMSGFFCGLGKIIV